MLHYFKYFRTSLHRPHKPQLAFGRFLHQATFEKPFAQSQHNEAGAAILILTCFASALMIGYSLAMGSDGVLMNHKKHNDNINLFSDFVFSTLREKIANSANANANANNAQSLELCGTDLSNLLNLGDGPALTQSQSQSTIPLSACNAYAAALGERSLPFNMIDAQNSEIIIEAPETSQSDRKKLRRVFTVKLNIHSRTQAITTVAYEFTVNVLRFSDFGLTLRNSTQSVVSQGPRIKIYSPTFIPSNATFNYADVTDGDVEFRDTVVTRASDISMQNFDTNEFQQTFRAGLVTNAFNRLTHHPGGPPNEQGRWTLDDAQLVKWIDPIGGPAILYNQNSHLSCNQQSTSPPDHDQFYYADGDNRLFTQVSPPSEVHPKAANSQNANPQNHSCLPGGDLNYHWHLPYFFLNPSQSPPLITIRYNAPTLPHVRWHKRILCAVFVANELTIKLDGKEDFIFFGIMSVNKLKVTGSSDATLHIINPLHFKGGLIDFDHTNDQSLSSYLQEHHGDTAPTLKSMSEQLRSHSPAILSNFFHPVGQDFTPLEYDTWYNNRLSNGNLAQHCDPAGVFPFAYEDTTYDPIMSLYDLAKDPDFNQFTENNYKKLGRLSSRTYYTVKMKRLVDDDNDASSSP